MPRRLRSDFPGAWHHLWNRGIAKRSLFETRKDVRHFLACLAREVRFGDIEVHAYSVMTTHFHLLVRSPRGRLSAGMQKVQDAYARWFNIGRRRDGPLFRGRFGNRIVDSETYWWAVLRYIDRNPVDASLCTSPRDYPHGSARHYCRPRGPVWLRRDAVEGAFGLKEGGSWDPGVYEAFADESLSPGQRWVAERRRELPPNDRGHDPLDELLGAAPERVRLWMDGKARLADGTLPGHVLVAPGTIVAVLQERRSRDPGRMVSLGRKAWPFWETLETGALREFCGQRFRELEQGTGRAVATVQARLRMHDMALREDASYLAEAASVLAEAVERDHGMSSKWRGRSGAGGAVGAFILRFPDRGRVHAG